MQAIATTFEAYLDAPPHDTAQRLIRLANLFAVSRTFMFVYTSPETREMVLHFLFPLVLAARKMLAERLEQPPRDQRPKGWALVREALMPLMKGARHGALTLNPAYWSEALHPRHLPVIRNENLKRNWMESDSQDNFVDWLRTTYTQKLTDLGELAAVWATLADNVKYANPAEQGSWRLRVVDGFLIASDGTPFDTTSMRHGVTGLPSAILVRIMSDEMLAREPVLNQFHHSSFVAGGPVLGAAEMMAYRGRLRILVNKSGYYQPSRDDFLRLLFWIKRIGVALEETIVVTELSMPLRPCPALQVISSHSGSPGFAQLA